MFWYFLFLLILCIIFIFLIFTQIINEKSLKKFLNKNDETSFNTKNSEKEIFYKQNKIKIIRNVDSKKVTSKSAYFYLTNRLKANLNTKDIYKGNYWLKLGKFEIWFSKKYIYLVSNDRSKKIVFKYEQVSEIIFLNRKKILVSFKSEIKNRPLNLKFSKSSDLIDFKNIIKNFNFTFSYF